MAHCSPMFLCPINHCGMSFDVASLLDKHTAAHDKKNHKLTCKKCGQKYFSVAWLLVHDDINRFQCTKCNFVLDTEQDVSDHFESVHTDIPQREWRHVCVPSRKHALAQVCPVDGCGKHVPNTAKLRQHMLVHTNTRAFKCNNDSCDATFRTNSDLRRHARLHSDISENTFKCEHAGCERTFRRRDNLLVHARSHDPDAQQQFRCPVDWCDMKLASAGTLRVHMKRHDNDRRFECDQPGCGKMYLTSSNLNAHLKSHERKSKRLDFPTAKQLLGNQLESAHSYAMPGPFSPKSFLNCPSPEIDQIEETVTVTATLQEEEQEDSSQGTCLTRASTKLQPPKGEQLKRKGQDTKMKKCASGAVTSSMGTVDAVSNHGIGCEGISHQHGPAAGLNPLLSTSINKPDLLDLLTGELDINYDITSASVGEGACIGYIFSDRDKAAAQKSIGTNKSPLKSLHCHPLTDEQDLLRAVNSMDMELSTGHLEINGTRDPVTDSNHAWLPDHLYLNQADLDGLAERQQSYQDGSTTVNIDDIR